MKASNLLLLAGIVFSLSAIAEDAAPSYCTVYQPEFIKVEHGLGSYMRVSPDGNFVITSSGGSNILDLRGRDDQGNRVAKEILTPMYSEAYPVEGNWRHITSPGNSTSFWNFKDLIANGPNTQLEQIQRADSTAPVPFRDDEHYAPYYHSAAELSGGDERHAKYRVALYSANKIRDYDIELDSTGHATKFTPGPIKSLCANLPGRINQPILSKDGTELGANYAESGNSGSTHIFKVNDDGSCEIEDNLGYQTYKTVFDYPQKGKRAKVLFMSNGVGNALNRADALTPSGMFTGYNPYVYDPNTKLVSPVLTNFDMPPNYPGWTRDGKILAQGRGPDGSAGILVIDPSHYSQLPVGTELPDLAGVKACFQDTASYFRAVSALGTMWQSLCNNGINSSAAPLLQALSLSPATCASLVHKGFEDWHRANPDSDLTEKHLQVACNALHGDESKPSVAITAAEAAKRHLDEIKVVKASGGTQGGGEVRVEGTPVQGKEPVLGASPRPPEATTLTGAPLTAPQTRAQAVFEQRCIACHSAGTPYAFDITSAASLARTTSASNSQPGSTYAQEIERRLNSEDVGVKMPMKGLPIEDQEKTDLLYFRH